jgi:hypothetical protein
VLFAFAPYRFPQSSHLQVLSSQWMPFALYGFRRFFDSIDAQTARGGRWRPLLGAAAALIAQNLSCTYYLMFFAPFVSPMSSGRSGDAVCGRAHGSGFNS